MQQTGHHRVCIIWVVLALVLSTSAFCAVPTPDQTDPLTSRIENMLTPRATIQLGVGRADTDLLTRRACNSSLNYSLLTNWRGILALFVWKSTLAPYFSRNSRPSW